jgi:hypothetical protein
MKDNTKQPTTYMLVGADWGEIDNDLVRLKDVVLLRASQYPDIKDAVAQIKGPANIILAAHGSADGYFAWGAGKRPSDSHAINTQPDGLKVYDYSYPQLFADLPRSGIGSVTIQSCFGAEAEKLQSLKNAPSGTIVQTMSSGTNVELNSIIDNFNDKLSLTQHPTPATLFLQGLRAFSSEEYQIGVSQTQDNSDPYRALPHIIGVGGPTPLAIDLDTQLRNLADAKTSPDLSQAVNLVQQNFNPGDKADIVNMALRIEHGDATIGHASNPQTNADELRVAYALTAAYLHTSGTMDKWVADAAKFTAPDLQTRERLADTMLHQSNGFPDPAAPLAPGNMTLLPMASGSPDIRLPGKPDVTVDVATLPAKDSDALAFLNAKIAQACATLDKNSISLGMSSYGELFSTPITVTCGKEPQQR